MKEKNYYLKFIVISLIVVAAPAFANPQLNLQLDSAIQSALKNKDMQKSLSKYSKKESKKQNKKTKNPLNNTKNITSEDLDTLNEDSKFSDYENDNYIFNNEKELSVIEEKFNNNTINETIIIPEYYFPNPEETNAIDVNEENNITSENNTLNEEERLVEKLYPNQVEKPKEPVIEQFGYNIFNTDISNILDMNIPVSDDYLLGPGDNLIIRVWGKIDQEIDVTIDNNGKIYLPKIGNIMLAGISYKNSHKVIKKALQQHYVNFELSITMGTLKTIKVFILGEVTKPGAYDISSLSTLFTALHSAEGPTKKGSLRKIQLKRNNKTVATVDLYKYLLTGNNAHDHKLKNYDTIFVPPIGDIIRIDGDVKRPAIYELNGKTTLYAAVYTLAGGEWGTSDKSVISIKRISKNKQRKFLNIETSQKNSKKILKTTILNNNDQISISSVLDQEKNAIRIIGEIHKPGVYDLSKNLSLYDLLQKSGGIKPNGDKKRIKLFRFISQKQRQLLFIDGSNKESLKNIMLEEWDIIEIDEKIIDYVYIQGAVLAPGTYQQFKDIKIADLVKMAKLNPSAADYGELIKYNKSGKDKIIAFNLNTILSNQNSSSNLTLEPNDTIFIPENPDKKEIKTITISGEVNFPGTYIIGKNESIENIIKRAGGLTSYAFLKGLELNRESIKKQEVSGQQFFLEEEQKRNLFNKNSDNDSLLNIDSTIDFISKQEEKAKGRIVIDFKNKNILSETTLENKDEIIIPKQSTIIPVIGGVQTARGVYFKKNKRPRYYINRVGGRNQFALKRTVYVFKANGIIKKNPSKIEQGDTIYIPQEIKEDWAERASSWQTTISIISNTLSSIILLQSLGN